VPGPDYKFNGAPINMSLDWQPSFEFDDGRGFSGSWGGPVYLLIYILSFISKKRKGSIIYGPFLFYILLRNQWI